jgi:hypothetical protein
MKKYLIILLFVVLAISFGGSSRARAACDAGLTIDSVTHQLCNVTTPHPTSGKAGKIVFVKKIIQGSPSTYQQVTDFQGIMALKDKFITVGECNSSEIFPQVDLWVASEDGSSVTPRNGCRDSALGEWANGFDALSVSKIMPSWENNGNSFIREVYSPAENSGYFAPGKNFNRSVLYQINGTAASPVSVAPQDSEITKYAYGLVALKDKIIARTGEVLSLPDWTKLGSIPPGLGGTAINGAQDTLAVGFGDYAVDLVDGHVYKVGPSSKTLVQTLPGFSTQGYASVGYTFDNSTWPSKLAIVNWSLSPDWATDHMDIGTIKVYSPGSNGLVLNKTLTVKDAYINNLTLFGWSVWGNYVAILSYGDLQSNGAHAPTLELWDGSTGTKIDEISISYDDPNNQFAAGGVSYYNLQFPAISKDGYLAISTVTNNGPAVYLYKLNVSGSNANNTALTCATGALFDPRTGHSCSGNSNSNTSSGSCKATLTFDKTSVASGGSMTETWSVDGADIGQVFGDCGAGEIPISAGPQSYTFNNIKNNMTCRVYGKIDGVVPTGCTATATVNVTGGGGGTGDINPAAHMAASMVVTAPDSSTLRIGSSGGAVVALQTFLNTNDNAGLTADGKFGRKTAAAVKVWQGQNDLNADGVVGPLTQAKMNLSY